jgi:hypothetical protein
MDTHSGYKENRVNGLVFLVLGLSILSLTAAVGQSPQPGFNDRQEPSKYPVYRGFEIALGFPTYTLQSNIPQLDHLQATFIGSTLGGVLANQVGKVKANIGVYYSGSSVPYTIDMLQGGISGNLYLLRLNQVKFHLVEPYATVGLSHQQAKFYGTYLHQDGYTNSSVSTEPLLGRTGWTQLSMGTGAEFQLENDNDRFIHLFTELCYGVPFQFDRSAGEFAKTRNNNPWWIAVGINFGVSK